MKTETFKVAAPTSLTTFIKSNVFGAGFAFCKTLLKNRDVKVNGERVGTDITLAKGDVVQIWYADDAIKAYKPYSVVFEDNNIMVVFKQQGIEVTSPTNKNTLEALIKYKAAHRLDVNTEGLVIFAKNDNTAEELRRGFDDNCIEKFYLALCFGKLNNSPVTLTGFLKKDSAAGTVEIIKEKIPGSQPIKTVVSFVKSVGDFSLLEIKPITGRTHQIRAHLSSIKLCIVGDGKYGDAKLNKVYGYNKQCLCAHALQFNFPSTSPLNYLNKKKLEVTPSFMSDK